MLRDRVHQRQALRPEPLAAAAGVLQRRLTVRHVLDDLAVALGEAGAGAVEPGGLVIDHAEALGQARLLGREPGLGGAQPGHGLARPIALRTGLEQPLGLALGARAAILERRPGGHELRPGEPVAGDQERRLDLPVGGAELAVALGLAGLLDEAPVLLLERQQQVLDPQQIGLGRLQLELGLVAARLQAADARRLLDQAPPVGGLGLDQGADLALADDRGAARARGRIREQQLHVARPELLVVGPEDRADAAADPAREVELVDRAQPRQGDLGRLDAQADLGQIERRPGRGAGEDDVVHLAAAQAARRGLAHHPAERVDQIRLAAAIRPDDPGQARLDRQLARMHEGFETGEAQPGDLQGAQPVARVRMDPAISVSRAG